MACRVLRDAIGFCDWEHKATGIKMQSSSDVPNYDREELTSAESNVIILRAKVNNKYLGPAAVYLVDKITGELWTLIPVQKVE